MFGKILQELLENKHKALVFSQFVGHLNLIRTYLDEKNIPMVPKFGWKWPRKRLPEQSNSSSTGVPSGFDKVLHHAPSYGFSCNTLS